MGLDELAAELSKVQFIINKYKAKAPETEYTIAGDKYTVQLNIRQMTAAQYIDFQNFYKDYQKNFKYIFLCFLIPKGKKYNEGYDLIELADKLYVSRQTVCRWENGSRCPDLITAKKLALELDVSMDELISDEDVNDMQVNYGIWKSERIKDKKHLIHRKNIKKAPNWELFLVRHFVHNFNRVGI